ncbi:hypothetical protein MN116_004586 [Schistosoma mekongi]|uniref:Uncharacterized protein n=1 Tax=Schistosoma mekongi TaxID=38744 RepID=A0AAE1ZD22_SCHME|nr:hypothetical protein MN116_004586 [Schistosoma mekongi]
MYLTSVIIITIIIYFNITVYGKYSVYSSRPRRLLPADSYTILGQAGLRRLGQCNITYAWLTSPPTSSLDAYGHATACTRLQLLNGQIITTSSYDNSNDEDMNQAEKELNHINKEWSASLVDLERLDLLIRAEVIGIGQSKQLANDPRYFFLADRVGDLNLMVVLRPDKQLKLELINPLASEHLVLTPQHVLCLRKQCPITVHETNNNESKHDNYSILIGTSTSTLTNSIALTKAERQNRELYMQLVISRVACALISFMCVVFAMTSLTLCIRLRQNPHYFKKRMIRSSQASICKESHPSPSYCQVNGKVNMSQVSPLFITDQSPRHYGITHLPSETASMNNIVMTASNMSTCDPQTGLPNIPISYSALGQQYAQISGYPISGGPIASYNDNGLITIYPVPSRGSISSTQRGLLLQCQNGSVSPAPSNNSDGKNGNSRTGSLGRYSRNSMCYGDSTRRKLMYPIKRSNYNPSQSMKQQSQQLNDALTPTPNNRPIPIAQQQQHQQQLHQSIKHNDNINGKPDDLISFQITPNFPTVIHRYPTELQYNEVKTMPNVDNDETNSDMLKSNTFNHVNEPCIGVIRKPAHVN